jgi:hypothetical protein
LSDVFEDRMPQHTIHPLCRPCAMLAYGVSLLLSLRSVAAAEQADPANPSTGAVSLPMAICR